MSVTVQLLSSVVVTMYSPALRLGLLAVLTLFDHKKSYCPLTVIPPLAEIKAVPLFSPKHNTFVELNVVDIGDDG